jgi:co-chaperonin GroES (HSP10)
LEEKVGFKPCNRHLLLKEVEEQKDIPTPTILVPDDYKANISPYGVYQVVDRAPDCAKLATLGAGDKVVVNEGMVENISVDGHNLVLILENHVYGVLES